MQRSLRQALRTISFLALMLAAIGCDSSESDYLLNPPIADSAEVRVVNLVSQEKISLSLGGVDLASSIGFGSVSSRRPLFFTSPVPLILTSSFSTDTIENQRVIGGIEERILTTYVVSRRGDSMVTLPLVVGENELTLLQDADQARIFLYNGTSNESVSMTEGCSSGAVLFGETGPGALAGTVDLRSGVHSLFLLDGNVQPLTSVRITLTPGEVTALLVVEGDGGIPEVRQIDLRPGSMEPGQLLTTEAETRSTTTLRIVNAIDEGAVAVETSLSNEEIVSGLSPRGVSSPVEFTACGGGTGDSLRVIESGGDTSMIPFTGTIGVTQTLLLYKVNGVTSSLLLEDLGNATAESVRIRGLNLLSSDTTYSIVVGAGAPGSLSSGALLLPGLRGGLVSAEKIVAPGLYPLALEFSSSGAFRTGGLHRFEPGSYIMIATRSAGSPELLILDASADSPGLVDLDSPGVRSLIYSANLGDPVPVSLSTSFGTLSIPEIAYSYVYPTVLPSESIDVTAGSASTTVSVGPDGLLIGYLGESGSGEIFTAPRNAAPAPSGRANLRFMNGVPGSGSLHVRLDGTEGEPLATLSYKELSDVRESDARRYSFAVTPEGQNDELARITGVQLSQLRNYLLVITPAQQDNVPPIDYSLLLIQE